MISLVSGSLIAQIGFARHNKVKLGQPLAARGEVMVANRLGW
jgi:hypothetical protein